MRLKSVPPAQDPAMYEPGLDRHEWESEWLALEDELREDPADALPKLDALVGRMLEETGYDLTDPVVREGDEREVVAEYLAAHEIAQAAERDADDLSLGDVAAAIDGYRAVFDHLVTTRAAADADLDEADRA
jgi:iron uptake system EfeUOB component EfeO/EfeM